MQGKDRIGGERREDRRYGLKLELRWKMIQRGQVAGSGVGHTLDLSSGGIRFHSGHSLPVGTNVTLSIAWPMLLDNVAPMLLAVHGKVVRSSSACAALRILQHEFRKQGVSKERCEQQQINAKRAVLA